MRHQRKQVKKAEHYYVRCADGKQMPWPRGVKVIEGVRPRVFTPETVVMVEDSLTTRRRIAAGCMVVVKDRPATEPVTEPVPKKVTAKVTKKEKRG